jgi:hypothetical protein
VRTLNLIPPKRRSGTGRRILTAAAVILGALVTSTSVLEAYSTFCGVHPGDQSTYYINPNFMDAGAGNTAQQIAALQAAADEWTSNGGSQFQWIYNGQSGKTSISTGDGQNVIYADPGNGGSTLAETWCSSSGGTIVGWDMRFWEGDHNWSISPGSGEFDIEGVAVHELGHALGLGHSSVSNASMYPSTSSGQGSINIRSIENDDKAGVVFLYGSSLGPPMLTSVSPGNGYARGGETITLTGTDFTAGMSVSFGENSATVLNVSGSTQCTVRAPKADALGAVDVSVQTQGGMDSLASAYTYDQNPLSVSFTGTPRVNKVFQVVVYGPPNAEYVVAIGQTEGPATIKGLEFCFARDATLEVVGKSFGNRPPTTANLDATGEISLSYTVPDDQSLVFENLYLQGAVNTGPGRAIDDFVVTNCVTVTVFP